MGCDLGLVMVIILTQTASLQLPCYNMEYYISIRVDCERNQTEFMLCNVEKGTVYVETKDMVSFLRMFVSSDWRLFEVLTLQVVDRLRG